MHHFLSNPWFCPQDNDSCSKVIHIYKLPEGFKWQNARKIFEHYEIDKYHFFGTEGLVEFKNKGDTSRFMKENGQYIESIPAYIEISPIDSLIIPPPIHKRVSPSRVICIQVIKLRQYLGIQDIFGECSHFGTVLKIICFENSGKFALVLMGNKEEAAMALANLNLSPRHLPFFQMRIQYSKNQDIIIKFNNAKSFDFTIPSALEQFYSVVNGLTGELPFFEPDPLPELSSSFSLFRPIQYDSAFGNVLSAVGFEEHTEGCDFIRNIFLQYGAVLKVKFLSKSAKKTAFVQMRNSFFARLAMANLQNMEIDNNTLAIEISSHSDVRPSTGQIDQSYKEYPTDDDPDISEYSLMWPPSRWVSIRPVGLKCAEFCPPGTKIVNNIAEFDTIQDAATFIGNNNIIIPSKPLATFAFIKPP